MKTKPAKSRPESPKDLLGKAGEIAAAALHHQPDGLTMDFFRDGYKIKVVISKSNSRSAAAIKAWETIRSRQAAAA